MKKISIRTDGTLYYLSIGMGPLVTLTGEELETLRDDIDAVAFEPEDRFRQMDEERTAMRLRIEELEEKIADLEEEN